MAKKVSASNVTPSQLAARVKAGQLLPVYLLFGEEQALLQAMTHRLADAAVEPSLQPLLLTRLDGQKLEPDALLALCRTFPLMGRYRCVVVSDYRLDKLSKADAARVLPLLTGPSPTTVLILTYSQPDLDLQKAAWKPWAEAVKKVGAVCEFAHKSPVELSRALCAYAQKQGGALSTAVAAVLVDRCGVEYSRLIAETDKLLAYAHGREITEKDIGLLCSRTIDSSAFDLAAALTAGQAKKAFSLLDELFLQRQQPVMILGAVTGSFMDLYRLRLALDRGVPRAQMSADFGYKSTWRLDKMARLAERYPLARIQDCLLALTEADRLLKSSKQDDRLILETAMGKMLPTGQSARTR